MTLDSLSDFIAAIEEAGELVRVRQPVAVQLEMCEIADRAMKMPGGGPALLFEHPVLDDGTASAYPVAINLFGSMSRMALALGVRDLDEIGARITQLMDLKVPDGIVAKPTETSPPTSAMTEGPPPLYGTCVVETPVITLNNSPARCDGVPLPDEE